MRILRRVPILLVLVEGFLMLTVSTAKAQDVRTGVEQLAAQIARAAPEGRQLRVAVADFPDLQNVTSDLGRYIASRLTTRLAQSPKFFVIERQRLSQVLAELKFSMSDLVDPAKAKRLGQMVGVEAIVVGTVSDLGNQVDLDARMIEIETNRMLLGTSVTISKDQVVAEMLTRGMAAPTPAAPIPQPPAGQSYPSSSTAALLATTPKTYNVQQVLTTVRGSPVYLNTIEMFGSHLLRFHLTYQQFGATPGDLILEGPTENALLTDDRGRRYGLIEATGISGDRPVNVPAYGQKRFSLLFPFRGEGVSGFRFEAVLRVNEDRQVLRWEGTLEKFR